MNKLGQLDEINPVYILMAIVGGLVGWFVAGRASTGIFLPILTGALSAIACYAYLVFTDR